MRWDLYVNNVITTDGHNYRERAWLMRKHPLRRRGRLYSRPNIVAREVPPGKYVDAPDGLGIHASSSGTSYPTLASIDMAIEELTALREKWMKIEHEHQRRRKAARKDER